MRPPAAQARALVLRSLDVRPAAFEEVLIAGPTTPRAALEDQTLASSPLAHAGRRHLLRELPAVLPREPARKDASWI